MRTTPRYLTPLIAAAGAAAAILAAPTANAAPRCPTSGPEQRTVPTRAMHRSPRRLGRPALLFDMGAPPASPRSATSGSLASPSTSAPPLDDELYGSERPTRG